MAHSSIEFAIASKSSRLSGFYDVPPEERRRIVARWAGLQDEDLEALDRPMATGEADHLVENVIGTHSLPVGVATNFLINGRDRLVPMAVEEPSVIAAASHGALLTRPRGGFVAQADAPVMIGQIQVLDLDASGLGTASARVLAARDEILAAASVECRTLNELGGGPIGVETRTFPETSVGPMLVVHLLVDCRDAMGANAVNTACEAVSPIVEDLTGGRVVLRILSNLADQRLARASCAVPAARLARKDVPGEEVAQRIVEAHALAEVDPYRAATHNKGVMNGVDAVVVATGNDWRSVEAGAHAYAARSGAYRSLTSWWLDDRGDLCGSLEMPMALGTVGGGTRAFPAAGSALKILGATSARDLAEVAVCVGLAQNLSALRALAAEGIQSGHMALHARQVAVAAGARGPAVDRIARQLVAEGAIRASRAGELVAAELRATG